MAPKRNVKISAPEKVAVDSNSEKPPKGRLRKAQSLKVPSTISISIPINKAGLEVPDAEKKVDKSTKVALADEVARAQILKEPIAARVIPPTPKRTRGRKKEVVSEFFNTSAIKEEPVEEIVPTPDLVPTTPTAVKKNNRKSPVKNSQDTKGVSRKRVADSTVKKPRIKRQKITPKTVTKIQEKGSIEETIQDDSTKADSTEPIVPKVQSEVPKNNSENTSDVNSNVFSPHAVSSPKKRLLRGKRTIISTGENIQTAVEANSTEASNPIAPASKPDDNTSLGVDSSDVTISGTKSNAKRTKSSKPQSSCIKSHAKEADTLKVNNPVDALGVDSPDVPISGTKLNAKRTKPSKPQNSSIKSNAKEADTLRVNNPVDSLSVDSPDVSVPGTKSNAKRTKSSKPQSSCIKSLAKEVDTVKVSNPVDSRKNSISSTSNLSWTRDISSSSATTCFTVASKDFFCFDKKMPVLKLVNIDNKVDNYTPKPLEEDSTSDSSSSSSSSSDSESSSEEESSEVNLGSNSPVKVNSLNLSSSSCKSLVTAIEEPNIHKKDYSKAAENLMQALNKIDMEFINWIHDADSITSDLDRIKDSLFDILSNEFYAITHCRNLQEILNTDVSDSNNVTNKTNLTTEKVKGNNTVERKPKTRFKKTTECNTFEKRRTRSSKSDVNTEVESDLVRSKTECNTFEKRPTRSSKSDVNTEVESDLVRSKTECNTFEKRLTRSSKSDVNTEVESDLVRSKTEYNTFEKRRTRSSKSDVNTEVESDLVRSKKIVSDTAKRSIAECNAIKNKTGENDLIKSNIVDVEVDPLRINTVTNDANKNKIVDNNPVYKNNLINNKSDDSNAAKINKKVSNSINNIDNSPSKIDRIENIPVNAIKINPVERRNRVENNPDNRNKVENKLANNRQESTTFNTNRVENITGSSNRVEKNSIVNIGLENDHTRSRVEIRTEDELLKPSTSGFSSNTFNNSLTRRHSRVSESSESSSNQDTNAEHDDDDALSLFAESITGIESSRINTSIISAPVEKQLEEYIPKPIQKDFVSPQNYSYCPTRITDQIKNGVTKTICEKQNADSTSIYKESNSLPPEETGSISDSVESNQEFIEKPGPSQSEINIPNNIHKITLMADVYRLRPKECNIIFQGYCFFNLIHKCNAVMYSKPCRHSHAVPDNNVITNKLSALSNDVLIKEYMLIRRNDHVFRRYGILVLFQCVQRDLTRIVVEIAYDFIMRHAKGVQINGPLKTSAVEIALLHLNNVDLSVCEDLLFLVVPDGSLLCEVFMHVMTSTQNFSRFKSVFLSLTYFMVNNDRTFSLEVAEQILERVCILPFDEPLIRALIQIIRLTKQEIFLNSMIENFENLISVNCDVLDQYMSIKSEVNFEKLARKVAEQRPVGQAVEQPMLVQTTEPVLAQSLARPLLAQTVDPMMNVRPEMREGVPLPPSPDTTHLDNMNKIAEDVTPKITRIIRGFSFAPNTHTAVSPSSSNSEEIIKTPQHQNWRNRSILQHIIRPNYPRRPQSMRPPMRMRPPGRGMRKGYPNNHRLVTFGGSPTVCITYKIPSR